MSNYDKRPPVLAQLPECSVIDCPEMASPRGGMQATVANLSGGGLSLLVKAWIFTCAKHTVEFAEIVSSAPRTEGS